VVDSYKPMTLDIFHCPRKMLNILLVSDDESTEILRNVGYLEYTSDTGQSNLLSEGNCIH
jgi:hypothetical protein